MLPLPRSALGAAPAATAQERGRPARVLKTFSPTQAGALKLARRFGDALVCVRHRASADGAQRITTVELVVAVETMQRRQHLDEQVALRLDFRDRAHRAALQQAGARWDAAHKLWHLPRHEAIRLGLAAQIVE